MTLIFVFFELLRFLSTKGVAKRGRAAKGKRPIDEAFTGIKMVGVTKKGL